MQRQGKYPVPEGASPVPGLEIAGFIEEAGEECTRFNKDDCVFGLIPGGGYAEYAVIHKDMAMPIPENFSVEEAAAIPEVFLTAWQGLTWLGNLTERERVLIHAGASGVGTAAIQLARQMNAEVLVTTSGAKHNKCLELGAAYAINYQQEDFAERVQALTNEEGVDVILDFVGAPYLKRNVDSLRMDGRLVVLAFMGGAKAEELNIAKLLVKRLSIIGSTLRSRPLDYQIQLTGELANFALPKFRDGSLRPVIDSVFPLSQAADAHAHMEANRNVGKIILRVA
ncbi:MAG: NADPH:quinone oxidoreductase [Bacteroidetes bacterium SW_11_45_7]|nr:MAG: NADPH:quinone oxidoreductase [Bacteroidetes bacterium SW_11_45_7]